MQVSFIVPNYNGSSTLRPVLESVFAQDLQEYEVIVVDDGSSDGSVELIGQYFPQVRVFQNRRNRRAAYARNLGAREAKGEYLFFLDSDVSLSEHCTETLLNAARDAVITYPTIDYVDGHRMYPVEDAHRGFLVLSTAFLMRRRSLEEAGILFDESYGMYYEDLDFFIQCHLASMNMKHCDQAHAVHLRTPRHHSDYQKRSERYFLESRNLITSFLVYWPWVSNYKVPIFPDLTFLFRQMIFGLFNIYWIAHAFSYNSAYSISQRFKLYLGPHERITEKNRVYLLGLFLKAIFWNLCHLREIFHKRSQLKARAQLFKWTTA